MLPSGMITLALGNKRIFKMKNSLFSGLVLLKRPPENLLLLEATLVLVIHATIGMVPVSVVYDATPGCVDAQDPQGCLFSLLLPEVKLMSMPHGTNGDQVNVSCLCYFRRPWFMLPPRATLMCVACAAS